MVPEIEGLHVLRPVLPFEELFEVLVEQLVLVVGDIGPLRVPRNQEFGQIGHVENVPSILVRRSNFSSLCQQKSGRVFLFEKLLQIEYPLIVAAKVPGFHCALRVSRNTDLVGSVSLWNFVESEHYIGIVECLDLFTAREDGVQGLAS